MYEGVRGIDGMMPTGETEVQVKLVPVSLVCLKSHIVWSGNESGFTL